MCGFDPLRRHLSSTPNPNPDPRPKPEGLGAGAGAGLGIRSTVPCSPFLKSAKSFAGRVLFEDVSLQVNRGDRIGLVGPNGAGKSTLFSLILGEASPDAGKVSLEKNMTVGFLPQEAAAAGEETVLELACGKSHQALEENTTGRSSQRRSASSPVWPFARAISSGRQAHERRLGHARAPRAAARQEPDLLLLDEPTNHLDLESLVWFQEYLRELSRRDPDDLARSRIPEPARREHRRDRAIEAASVIAATRTATSSRKPRAKNSSSRPTRISRRRSRAAGNSPTASAPRPARRRRRRASSSRSIAWRRSRRRLRRRRRCNFRFPQPPRSGQRVITLKDVRPRLRRIWSSIAD